MELSFSKWLIICEIFKLDQGRVLNLHEALELSPESQSRIDQTLKNYRPGPYENDGLVSAVLGLKPAAIINYHHHPENPAAAFVADSFKKDRGFGHGKIQAELLAHGIKVRPDFHIAHMNLPNYSTNNIIIGGKKYVEELMDIYKCQFFLDMYSSPDYKGKPSAEVMDHINRVMQGKCTDYCTVGDAGQKCQIIHKRIGQLLGYTDEQVDGFVNSIGGYKHMPDLEYPVKLPPALAAVPRKQGFN